MNCDRLTGQAYPAVSQTFGELTAAPRMTCHANSDAMGVATAPSTGMSPEAASLAMHASDMLHSLLWNHLPSFACIQHTSFIYANLGLLHSASAVRQKLANLLSVAEWSELLIRSMSLV